MRYLSTRELEWAANQFGCGVKTDEDLARAEAARDQKTALEPVRTWKVQVTSTGVSLTLNGKAYELGASASAIVFDLERAAVGYTVPDRA